MHQEQAKLLVKSQVLQTVLSFTPYGKAMFQLKRLKKWRYDVFNILLLEQNITRKGEVYKIIMNVSI